jgi:hypothetical protein
VQALPQAAFFLFLEAAVGGVIALFWIHLRGEVPRGFALFTGVCFWVCGALALWLRLTFPPIIVPDVSTAVVWFAAERALLVAFLVVLGVYLLALRRRPLGLLAPLIPLLGLGALWAAALVDPGGQLGGIGSPLAVLAGAMALGSAVTALSLGHWYLVTPSLSVRPLIQLTFVCLGALVVQLVLLPLLLWAPGSPPGGVAALFGAYALFFGVRIVFGLLVPLGATVMAWRTARIRSLDSATGLLYIVSALVLAGEIVARTLYFLTGAAT